MDRMDQLNSRPILFAYPCLESGIFAWLSGLWRDHQRYLLFHDQEWFSDYRHWPGIPFGVKQDKKDFECLLGEDESRALQQKASDHQVLLRDLNVSYFLADPANSDKTMLVLINWLRQIIIQSKSWRPKDEIIIPVWGHSPAVCQLYQVILRDSFAAHLGGFMVALPPLELLFAPFMKYYEAAINKRMEGLIGRAKTALRHDLKLQPGDILS